VAVVKQPITRFILEMYQPIYYRHRKQLLETGEPQGWELRMLNADGSIFWAHLHATVVEAPGEAPTWRIVLADVTTRKTTEEALARLRAAGEDGPPYDGMFLDWDMPGLSGAAFVEAVGEAGLALPMRTVVVSPADTALLRHEVTAPEIVELVQKPLLPSVLRRLCRGIGEEEGNLATTAQVRTPGVLSGMQILMVEDDEINQQVASEILRDWGATVDIAANGRAALNLLLSRACDTYAVVLMDLEMPVMDGCEAVRRLRADGRFGTLPILAMTAHTLGPDLQHTLAENFNGYIAKPFVPDELLTLLHPYLRTEIPMTPGIAPQSDPLSPRTQPFSPEAFIETLKTLTALEPALLIRRFGERIPFLAKALREFALDARAFPERLRESLRQGDREMAHRLAHSFKGLAGTFAAHKTASAAQSLEAAILDERADLSGQMAGLESCLQALLAQLSLLPEIRADSPSPQPLETAELDGRLATLRRLLIEGDGEAEELWRATKAHLGDYCTPLQLAAVERAINHWDVDEALAALASLSRREEKQ